MSDLLGMNVKANVCLVIISRALRLATGAVTPVDRQHRQKSQSTIHRQCRCPLKRSLV